MFKIVILWYELNPQVRCAFGNVFTLGSNVHDWVWPRNGPFWTKNGQTWQACQRSKVVQKSPKGTKMGNLSVLTIWDPFYYHVEILDFWHGIVKVVTCFFRPFSDKNKLKFDIDSLIGLKSSIKFKDWMPWVRYACGNVLYASINKTKRRRWSCLVWSLLER